MTSKISTIQELEEEIEKKRNEFEKAIAPLLKKIDKIEFKQKSIQLEKNKGIIFTKRIGKDGSIYRILRGIDKGGMFICDKIVIKKELKYSIEDVKERRKVSTKELQDKICEVSP